MAEFTATVQVRLDPAHPPPLQPEKTAPLFGVAVSVTILPLAYGSEQSEPQLIPAGVLVIVPGPDLAIVSVYVTGLTVTVLKLAVTVIAPLLASVQGAVPAQLPLQPVKAEPAAATAARVTAVPAE